MQATQAQLDELIRAVDEMRGALVGIERLIDSQICAIRDALETDMADSDCENATAKQTVARCLRDISARPFSGGAVVHRHELSFASDVSRGGEYCR